LARFATPKLDILDARYEFMNRSEVPYVNYLGNWTIKPTL
jgi:hypothetical protein